MYELELAQKWDEVYANQIIYRAIKALGYSDNYLAKTVQYLAAYCPDKTILKKCQIIVRISQCLDRTINYLVGIDLIPFLSQFQFIHIYFGTTRLGTFQVPAVYQP